MSYHQYRFISSLQRDMVANLVSIQYSTWREGGLQGEAYGENDNLIKLYYRPEMRNHFVPVFYGEISEHGNGTLITGNFQTHKAVKGFLWFMRAMLIIFTLLTIFFTEGDSPVILLYISLLAMFLFTFLLEVIGKFFDGGMSKKAVIDFIEKELNAVRENYD